MILRSSYHMTNVLVHAESVRVCATILAPVDDAKIAKIDRRDLAAVAAMTLSRRRARRTDLPAHRTRTSSPSTTSRRSCPTCSTRRSRSSTCPRRSPSIQPCKPGLPAGWRGVAAVHRQLKCGAAAQTTDVVRVLLGRDPFDFANYPRDTATIFR